MGKLITLIKNKTHMYAPVYEYRQLRWIEILRLLSEGGMKNIWESLTRSQSSDWDRVKHKNYSLSKE